MKIPYKLIQERLDLNPSIDQLSDILFQLGHEHEIKNNVFEMEFTPNRGDCLSLDGLLRDIAFFYKSKSKPNIYEKELAAYDLKFTNKIIESCPKISFLKINIDKLPKNYHGELNVYFNNCDNKKINFFTDISNYLSFETGQPTHCYDASKIKGELSLEIEKNNIEFETLLDKKITLKGNNAVFKIGKNIINLAGIVGGESTSCSETTKEVIIECAYFDPEIIIGKTVLYDIQSDAAYKFERGVDPFNQEYVLRRFIQIVSEHTLINDIKYFSEQLGNIESKKIDLDFTKIKNIIGIQIEDIKIIEKLENLGFVIDDQIINVPSYRSDINSINDICEEIARIIGYDNIDPIDFNIPNILDSNKKDNKEHKIKQFLMDQGFNEVINFPFVKQKSNIRIDNALDSNKKYMRSSLKESLLSNYIFNERRQKDSVKLFEITDIYDIAQDVKSKKILGVIGSGRLGKNYKSFNKKIDAKYLKKILGKYTDQDLINISELNKEHIGIKSKDKVFFCEIELDKFTDDIITYESSYLSDINGLIYDPVSEYPSSIRDLSFSIKDHSKLNQLHDQILSTNFSILKEVFVFDFYDDAKNKVLKIGFRFIFQSKDKTITDNEVDIEMDKIINNALLIESVSIPGLKT